MNVVGGSGCTGKRPPTEIKRPPRRLFENAPFHGKLAEFGTLTVEGGGSRTLTGGEKKGEERKKRVHIS